MIIFKSTIILLLIYSIYCKIPKKIIGGEQVQLGEFNFVVSIRYNNFHICGGTIINNYYILTAAHCVYLKNDNIKILSGTIDSINENSGFIHDVSLIIYHSKFNINKSNNNDIAIIKLKKPIIFNSYQKSINLPSINDIYHYDKLLVAGWGLTSHPLNNYPRYLQKLTMTIVDNNLCQINHTRKIHDDHICVIGNDRQGLCIYDSGGPLILDNKIIIGIISWGRPCAQHGIPDVCISCLYHLSWIKNVLKKFSSY